MNGILGLENGRTGTYLTTKGGAILKKIIILALAAAMSAGVTACAKKPAAEEHGAHEHEAAEGTAFLHIHGLGYSRDGERLYIPVHNGIKIYAGGAWSDAPGDKHDYMGFSAADNGFYSSGHPAEGTRYKNPLGLIRSTDEGQSITVLALEGEVDLHGMAVSYRTHTLYALNPEPNSKMKQQGLFYSRDEGKTWTPAAMAGVSGQITSLAVHPSDDKISAIGITAGTYVSRDYGQTYAQLDPKPASALTFTDQGELLIGSTGAVELRKVNPGTGQAESWKPASAGEAITYISANPADPKKAAYTTEKKNVYVTSDGGATWAQIAEEGQAADGK
ncbi:F510_1955 family glycosylhydrolase [Paenibacillus mucilaginosus]|uniref:BNR repeat-containing glycosyl hydrolase n=1 Tax=Paenibacillus mucilaginosus (strain KNP414) TaxID=1036673 RepID=F8FDE7_PAEMK|nr:glycosyl hydrolase [Paenibacillus mucilaginosus]AEI42117.1 BNR repeat-containing glycosyl hydrolase [Paenibacillus mucilaginosus KNP414]MCG7214098.1 glycosyl hydrolase [Paenibacillus mucilaginosus]WDM28620.1 glycosyl hydrolase [Paenibacillus mucilaginosus]